MDTHLAYFFNAAAGKNPVVDATIVFFGDYLAYVLIIVFAIYVLYALRANKERLIALTTAVVAGLLARFGVTSTIRFFYHRPRPFIGLEGIHPLIQDHLYSFPSGHASFFFAFSTIVYSYHKKLGIAFFIASILMGVGRVMAGIHYVSDILAGAVVGLVCGLLVQKVIKTWRNKQVVQTKN